MPIRRIVCPTDFSEPSYQALRAANEFAHHFGAEIVLVHVVAPPPIIPVPEAVPVVNAALYQREMTEASDRMLTHVLETHVRADVAARVHTAEGPPAETIVQVAAEEEADLIIISTHGYTGWRHLVFGSVTEKVMRLAPCAVLTVRTPER